MKPLLLALALFRMPAALAQDSVVLRHPNGLPALTGRCAFFLNPHLPSTPSQAATAESADRRARNRETRMLGGTENPSHDYEPLQILLWLNLSCDGPVTLYYRDGSMRARTTFSGGVPTGPYTEYFPDGGVAERCTLDRGMISGEWARFYRNGKPFVTGIFAPYSSTQLTAAWEGILADAGPRNWQGVLEEALITSGYTREGLQSRGGSEASAVQPVFGMFEPYLRKIPTNAAPDGHFHFWNNTGKTIAEMQFAGGLRVGIWKVYDTGASPPRAHLEYRSGRLTHVTGTDGKRLTLEEFTKRWQDETPASAEPAGPGGADLSVVEAPAAPVEVVPSFVDGMPQIPFDLNTWIAVNVRYPEAAKAAGLEGRVLVEFIVEKDGSLTDPKVLRSIGGGCDEEALRLVRTMPKWTPGKNNGVLTRVRFRLPIKFTLSE